MGPQAATIWTLSMLWRQKRTRDSSSRCVAAPSKTKLATLCPLPPQTTRLPFRQLTIALRAHLATTSELAKLLSQMSDPVNAHSNFRHRLHMCRQARLSQVKALISVRIARPKAHEAPMPSLRTKSRTSWFIRCTVVTRLSRKTRFSSSKLWPTKVQRVLKWSAV